MSDKQEEKAGDFARPIQMRGAFPCIEIANVRLDAGFNSGEEKSRDSLIEKINAAHRAEVEKEKKKARQEAFEEAGVWKIRKSY